MPSVLQDANWPVRSSGIQYDAEDEMSEPTADEGAKVNQSRSKLELITRVSIGSGWLDVDNEEWLEVRWHQPRSVDQFLVLQISGSRIQYKFETFKTIATLLRTRLDLVSARE